MVSPTQWTWVWVNSRSWWWTGRPGVLRFMGHKGSDTTERLNWTEHVWIWELDHKESWVPKNWCFWTVVLEKTLESPLDSKAIQPVYPKGNQSWILIGRTDAEAETPILRPPDETHWKTLWCWGRLTVGEGDDRGWDGWMASLTQWTWVWVNSGDGDRPGGLVCCSPWGHKESDMTEWLTWTELNWSSHTDIKSKDNKNSSLYWELLSTFSNNYQIYHTTVLTIAIVLNLHPWYLSIL